MNTVTEQFRQYSVVKSKPKKSLAKHDEHRKSSEPIKAQITCSGCKARKNVSEQIAIGFELVLLLIG